VEKADVVVVATPWPEFADIARIDSGFVFDYWRIIPAAAMSPTTQVFYPGVGPSVGDSHPSS
jgi:UDP-N-acetyl-D-mannosaminuronate dehydrogenase